MIPIEMTELWPMESIERSATHAAKTFNPLSSVLIMIMKSARSN